MPRTLEHDSDSSYHDDDDATGSDSSYHDDDDATGSDSSGLMTNCVDDARLGLSNSTGPNIPPILTTTVADRAINQNQDTWHFDAMVDTDDQPAVPLQNIDIATLFTKKPRPNFVRDAVLADVPIEGNWTHFMAEARQVFGGNHRGSVYRKYYNGQYIVRYGNTDGEENRTYQNLFHPTRLSLSPTLVVDCVTARGTVDTRTLISQVSLCYQYYTRAKIPTKLCILADNAFLRELKHVDRYADTWTCFWKNSLNDLLGTIIEDTDERFQNFVLLTMQSDRPFQGLMDDHVYILGCVLDQSSPAYYEHVKSIIKDKSLMTMQPPVTCENVEKVVPTHMVFKALLARTKLTIVDNKSKK